MQEKKCPFRLGPNREFLPCLGTECMAYYDYDAPDYTAPNWDRNGNCIVPQKIVHLTGCMRLAPKPISYCGL